MAFFCTNKLNIITWKHNFSSLSSIATSPNRSNTVSFADAAQVTTPSYLVLYSPGFSGSYTYSLLSARKGTAISIRLVKGMAKKLTREANSDKKRKENIAASAACEHGKI